MPTEDEIRSLLRTPFGKSRRAQRRRPDQDPALHRRPRRPSSSAIRLDDVDLDACRIRITQGKGNKDRVVPFPAGFKETLALHIDAQRRAGAVSIFESSWKKPYTDRGVRKILTRYTQAAGIDRPDQPAHASPLPVHLAQDPGIDDALIQPYSGHATRQSLEIYSRMALADAQQRYDDVIGDFPV